MQRQERFHMDYMKNVETLIETISPHIQHKYKDLPEETRHANMAVAEFLKVLNQILHKNEGKFDLII